MRRKNSLNILFVGVLDLPWSTNLPMMREFQKKGHRVIPFNYRTIVRKYDEHEKNYRYLFKEKLGNLLRKPCMPRKLQHFYYKSNTRRQMNNELLSKVKSDRYDLVFFSKAGGIDWQILPEINKYANTWYWFMDPIKTAREMHAIEFASECTWCSATFSNVHDYFKTHNKNSYFITEGFDLSLYNEECIVNKEIELIFVGGKDDKRKKIIDYLKKNDTNIVWFGPGADNPPIYLDELKAKYKQSKLILNFTRDKYGFSDRVFQAMGLGSMVLSEYCYDIEKLFDQGKHLDWFRTKEDCLSKIRYYLENEDIREKIANEGTKHVKTHFSWTNTIDKILKIVGNI